MTEVDFFENCKSFLEEICSFRHPGNPQILYIQALMAYERGEINESQELLNQAKTHGLDETKVRLRDFQDVLQNLEYLKSAEPDDVAQLSIVPTETIAKIPDLVEQHCRICGKVFKKAFTLKRHLSLHWGEKNYDCSICGKLFGQKYDLTRHKLTHGLPEFPCTFDGCQKKFKTMKNMKNHLKVHDSERKTHLCSVCGKTFKSMQYLNAHMASHQDFKFFNCNYCDKEFALERLLKSHMAVHSNSSFSCQHCHKTFKRKSDLKHHCRNVHVIIPDGVSSSESSQ